MPTYSIEWKPSAAKSYKALPKKEQKRIAKEIDSLGKDPTSSHVKKLSGKEDIYRLRIGDYRVIYQVQNKILIILITAVQNNPSVA